MTEKTRTAALRAALVVLFALAVTYRLRSWSDVATVLADPDRIAIAGFALDFGRNEIAFLAEAGEKAGLRPGDLLLSVGDEPYTGRAVLGRALARRAPGDRLAVEVQRPGTGETLRLLVTLQAADPPSPYFLVTLGFFNPLVCLVLGSPRPGCGPGTRAPDVADPALETGALSSDPGRRSPGRHPSQEGRPQRRRTPTRPSRA